MKWCAFVLSALFLALTGCLGGPETVPMRPAPPPLQVQPGADPADPWNVLSAALTLDTSEHTRFTSAAEARKCPALRVQTALEGRVDLRPGQPGFAEPGAVTLVVFWQMELTEGRAAAQHINDLARRYRQYGVRAVGIVERTRGADDAISFLTRQGIGYPVYYDTLGALKAMRKAARADDPLGRLVAIFIIDRKGLVRFYRGEFPYTEKIGSTSRAGDVIRGGGEAIPTGRIELEESTPAGQRIEDYLTTILREPY